MKSEPIKQENTIHEGMLERLIEHHLQEVKIDENTTDIFFNGTGLFVHSLTQGRYQVPNYSASKAIDLVRQIANVMGKNFNIANPFLDVTFGKYRLNSVFSSIARSQNIPCITYAIRVIYPKQRVHYGQSDLAPRVVFDFMQHLINKKTSILISGKTGSGKTELQKYLISIIPAEDRIIMIEDTYESHVKELNPSKDISVWIASDNQLQLSEQFSKLIRVGLRNMPDWMILSESRGKEAYEILHSVMTGHPMITTLHSPGPSHNLIRMAEMIGQQTDVSSEELLLILARHFPFSIHMEKIIDPVTSKPHYQIVEILYNRIQNLSLHYYTLYQNKPHLNYQDLPSEVAQILNIPPHWYEVRYE